MVSLFKSACFICFIFILEQPNIIFLERQVSKALDNLNDFFLLANFQSMYLQYIYSIYLRYVHVTKGRSGRKLKERLEATSYQILNLVRNVEIKSTVNLNKSTIADYSRLQKYIHLITCDFHLITPKFQTYNNTNRNLHL